ncbi:hypothetical protein F0919_15300 [Taibaiella lutea]|uniref:Uncharacterized protein n=1 Tax=Taibaiella lutea TaxID=2608001 RepID=A0A5M6CFE3_9BACT|nr:hypothetical protein [Taibaiella lutea]KAA5532165.1 hypothetical protein F0919_15300 [Taibaiella lutea]
MQRTLLYLLIITITGCGIAKPGAKYQFSDGYYSSRGIENVRKVYIYNQDSTIKVYPVTNAGKQRNVDTTRHHVLMYGQVEPHNIKKEPVFTKGSFDIDFLTIPIKYRFPSDGFVRQLNANLNGGLYLGYRKDFYILRYNVSPIGVSTRSTTHLGFSAGGYIGFGNTFISQYVTRGSVQSEYDGLVFNRGFAAIVALNRFTAGLAIGWDRLLDRNNEYWIYNNKSWVGIVLGLNLN